MKRVFMRDEIVAGVNDVCDSGYRTVPAGGRRSTSDAAAKFQAAVKAAQINAKLDQLADLLTRRMAKDTALREQQAARRGMAVGSIGGASSLDDLLNQYREANAEAEARRCAEQKALYDAKNPHKRKEAAV